jgi:4-hydroxy-tetrahydrodipicolinate reductase
MNIALIGYGKMGHAIESIAIEKNHKIVLAISSANQHELTEANLRKADAAIEFTNPHSAVNNVLMCINAGVPVVCGSTGWLQDWDKVATACKEKNGTLLYASNFSVGVNIFFELNKKLAMLMANRNDYHPAIEEIHHTAKKDAPSGTAITLAEQIIENIPSKNSWVNDSLAKNDEISIVSKRIDPAPGTHHVKYHSAVDDIEIIHTAHSRQGFAAGALLAAEYIFGKHGIFTMADVLNIQ